MDALSILGGAAKGVNEYHEQSVKEGVIDRENAIKDYQIKKNAEEEAFNNKMIPVSSVFPNYKEMPKTFENFKETMQSQGFGSGFVDGDIPSIRVGDAKEVMKLMAMKKDLAAKQIGAVKGDLVDQFNHFNNLYETGADAEGKKFKPEELDGFKKKRDQAANAYTNLLTMEGTNKLLAEKIKAHAKMGEKTIVGKDKRTGKIVNSDKSGQLYNSDNSPFTGSEADIEFKGELIRETPTQSTSFGVIRNDTPKGPTPEEQFYAIIKKETPDRYKDFDDFLQKGRYKKSGTGGGPVGGATTRATGAKD